MTGVVDPRLQPLLTFAVVGPDAARRAVVAVLDTGYSGALTLPAAVIADLGLIRDAGDVRSVLADGSVVSHPVYHALIDWDGVLRPILVDQAECEPLLGMQLLAAQRVTIDAEPGGPVEIRPRPPRPAAPDAVDLLD